MKVNLFIHWHTSFHDINRMSAISHPTEMTYKVYKNNLQYTDVKESLSIFVPKLRRYLNMYLNVKLIFISYLTRFLLVWCLCEGSIVQSVYQTPRAKFSITESFYTYNFTLKHIKILLMNFYYRHFHKN